jgi:hypothetical protein
MIDTADVRLIRRWCAYFRGWSQAFGAHELIDDRERGLRWLIGDEQLGLILTPAIKRLLYPGLLGRHAGDEPPLVRVGARRLIVGGAELAPLEAQRPLWSQVRQLLTGPADLHLYQTYHLIYPTGTRILTLSRHAPLPLIYRELAPLAVQLDPHKDTAASPGDSDDPSFPHLRGDAGPC